MDKTTEYITFILKDEELNYRTVSTVNNEENLSLCEGYFNSKYFIKACKGMTLTESINEANNIIDEITKTPYTKEELQIRNTFKRVESFIELADGDKIKLQKLGN